MTSEEAYKILEAVAEANAIRSHSSTNRKEREVLRNFGQKLDDAIVALLPLLVPGECQWYALCANDAAGTVAHPILGNVPTCQRCADKHELKLESFKKEN